MKAQNQIKRTLAELENIESIRELLESNELIHRFELAQLLCQQFGYVYPLEKGFRSSLGLNSDAGLSVHFVS